MSAFTRALPVRLKPDTTQNRQEIPMALFGNKRRPDHACDDLANVGPTLGDAIDRFARIVINVPQPRTTTRASNLAAHFPRLRPAKARRPVRPPLLRPQRLRSPPA